MQKYNILICDLMGFNLHKPVRTFASVNFERIVIVKTRSRSRFVGMACFPFIFLRRAELRNNPVFLNHERIHLMQQLEMGILPFYIWYTFEYLLRLLRYKKRHLAYRNISFEREAYARERDLQYLNHRKPWSFLKYL